MKNEKFHSSHFNKTGHDNQKSERIYHKECFSSSLFPHFGACSRFWSIGLSFLSFFIRDNR
jgi:hypothetical protein